MSAILMSGLVYTSAQAQDRDHGYSHSRSSYGNDHYGANNYAGGGERHNIDERGYHRDEHRDGDRYRSHHGENHYNRGYSRGYHRY